MKALIATGIGVLGLGALLVGCSERAASAQAPQPAPVVMNSSATGVNGPTLVNCGEGRQAVFFPADSGMSRVECVARPTAAALPVSYGEVPLGATSFAPVPAPAVAAPVTRTVVEERVVYRDRPVTRTTSARRSAPVYRTSSASTSTSRSTETYRKPTRSWKKSAVIIGGSTAGGAGVGAILGGKGGAKKGAVVGLLGGTIYDIATRNK
jgi:hypothetical protein